MIKISTCALRFTVNDSFQIHHLMKKLDDELPFHFMLLQTYHSPTDDTDLSEKKKQTKHIYNFPGK